MIIIGAGMSGLLAGALNPGSVIYEARPEGVENHRAVFRCKKPDIGKILGIPFKKVTVHKAIWFEGREVEPTPRIAHMYSKKITGTISARSIFDISSVIRYMPPADFLTQLKKRCNIKWNTIMDNDILGEIEKSIISTIPLFSMAKLCSVINTSVEFSWQPIYVNQIPIPICNSHCTIYYPDSKMGTYRASICGNILITEGMKPLCYDELILIFESMGIPFEDWHISVITNHKQKLGKITPMNEKERKRIITQLTLEFGIYSLGRFATWRPKVMLDDVLEDIFVIRRLIEEGHYGSIKHKQGENS